MYFFKYFKSGILERNMLRRGELFFAKQSELNDENEFKACFMLKGSREHWERFADLILWKVYGLIDTHPLVPSDSIAPLLKMGPKFGKALIAKTKRRNVPITELKCIVSEAIEPFCTETFDKRKTKLIRSAIHHFCDVELGKLLDEGVYIASFSLDAQNPTMWGHYASAGSGFVVVYEADSPAVTVHSPVKMLPGARLKKEGCYSIGVFNSEELELRAVTYRTTPPKRNAFRKLSRHFSYSEAEMDYDVPDDFAGSPEPKEEAMFGCIKFSDWRYEREIRAFLPAYTTLPPAMRVLRVAPRQIKGLIFGSKMSEADKEDVIHCCHLMRESAIMDDVPDTDNLQQFAFLSAIPAADSPNRLKVAFKPVGMLDQGKYALRPPFVSVAKMRDEELKAINLLVAAISKPQKLTPAESQVDTGGDDL